MVYFIKSEDMRAIKIGYSNSHLGVIRRLKVMKTGNADHLDILTIIDESKFSNTLTHSLEKFLHIRFKHLKIRGEWFRAEYELLEFIA